MMKNMVFWVVMPRSLGRTLSEPHSIITSKPILFRISDVRTSNVFEEYNSHRGMELHESEKHYKGSEEGEDKEKQEYNGEERWKRKKSTLIFLLVSFFLFPFFSTSISPHLSSHCRTCLHAVRHPSKKKEDTSSNSSRYVMFPIYSNQ
jgi:hypothetical protein